MATVRRLTPLVLCAAALACGAATAHAALPDGFVGILSDELIDQSPKARQKALDLQASAGVSTLRQTFDWARIERRRGHYTYAEYDRVVLAAAKARIRVLPMLFNPPRFHSSRPRRRAHRGVYPPRHNSTMAAFARALARRYGPGGTLWKAHPKVGERGVHTWQVWNEPNLQVYWESGVSPTQYVKLTATVGEAIKSVDPDAEIVTAGLPQSTLRRSMSFQRFVRGMYKAGGADAFDSLAVHPYARTERGAIGAARLARRMMDARGDSSAGIWITEMGWASGGPPSTFKAGSRGQARLVGRALRALAAARGSLRLHGLIYFKWRDTRIRRGIHDFWGHHTGLLTARGKRKRSYFTFRRVARSLER